MVTPPRYLPSRPLPAQAYLPGRTSRVPAPGEPVQVLDPHGWRDHAAYLWGVDLYNHGYPWEAHEAWEGPWRAARAGSPVHDMLQGLIQSAAAVIKARTGHPAGLHRLAARALVHLDRVVHAVGPRFMGVDVVRFREALRAYAAARPLIPEAWPILNLDELDFDPDPQALPAGTSDS